MYGNVIFGSKRFRRLPFPTAFTLQARLNTTLTESEDSPTEPGQHKLVSALTSAEEKKS